MADWEARLAEALGRTELELALGGVLEERESQKPLGGCFARTI